MTLLSWKESNIAVNGEYVDGYCTFTAMAGRKFIILAYEFCNNGIQEQETPYLDVGEIVTGPKGYRYKAWSPPLGVHSEEYNPQKATSEEIKTLIGDAGAYERLFPEETVKGRIVFEIAEDATPIEANIIGVPYLIKF